MNEILEKIAFCVEHGKVNRASVYPAELKGQDGADELMLAALKSGIGPVDHLLRPLILGMKRIGEKFKANKVFLPDVIMAAKAMNAAMIHIEPYFASGEARHKGTFVIGTVAGDLHEIGKNIVVMMFKGAGWKVVDLGFNVSTEKFLKAAEAHHECVLGLSSLLTTTMPHMADTVLALKKKFPAKIVIVGGAPLTDEFAKSINADFYSPEPQGAIEFLERSHACGKQIN